MKKTIIFVVVGLLVGLVGGSFVRGTKERDVILVRMAAEKAVADSLAALREEEVSHASGAPDYGAATTEPEGGEETAPTDPGAEGGAEPAHESSGDTVHAETLEGDPEGMLAGRETPGQPQGAPGVEANPVSEPVQGGSPGLSPAAIGPGGSSQGPARLAKIFGAMDAKDAAAVLTNLSDDEVRVILLSMSDRKVAEILGEFAPERAASLSRIVLAARSGIGE